MFVKFFKFSGKDSYIKRNIYLRMNLKERGITVGDLLIVLIIILTSTILVKSFNKDKKTTINSSKQEVVTNGEILISKIHLTDLSF